MTAAAEVVKGAIEKIAPKLDFDIMEGEVELIPWDEPRSYFSFSVGTYSGVSRWNDNEVTIAVRGGNGGGAGRIFYVDHFGCVKEG